MYKLRLNYYINQYRSCPISFYKRGLFIFIGALLVACSLQFFLVKNYVIDGGIVGVSIIISHVYSWNVGLVLLVLNTPFLIIGHYYLGKRFLILSLYAILILAIGSTILEPFPVLTDNPLGVVVFGGFLLGLGVGVIIRYGGSLDGTEILAILLSERSIMTIGQYVLIFNFFIFGSAVFVYGMKEALYSLATFFIAYLTIDFTLRITR